MPFPALLFFALLVAAVPAAAEDEAARRYAECIALARSQPEQGWEMALALSSLGGGDAARHCAAVALIGLGKHAEAAARLESLARESRRENALRAGMLAQAAQAWSLAGQPERALADLDAALALAPRDGDLRIDRAVVLAEAGAYREALADLDAAVAAAPRRADALVLRAAAKRMLGDLDGAEADAGAALALEADQPDALLERGILHRLRGRDDQARQDWLSVLAAAPDSPAAEAARRNLERLDVDKGG